MNPYIKIIRPINLSMVVLTQLLFWFFIMIPIHERFGSIPELGLLQVILIMLSTILIAAGGYVINDYYDLPIDLINKPEKVIISDKISDDNAFTYYMVLTGLGIVCSTIVAFTVGKISLLILPVIIASLLWFYAQTFKRMFLIGNIIVSLTTACVIYILIHFEIDRAFGISTVHQSREFLLIGGAYMLFAFIISMLRELIKDLQDRDGDEQMGCKTIPIVAGEKVSKIIGVFYGVILLAAFGSILSIQINERNWLQIAYLIILLIFPSILAIYKIVKSKNSNDYNSISTLVKVIMFFGIITMIYFGFVI